MKKFFLMAALVAFVASVGTGCKKDPCEKAMNKLAEMTGKAGEKAPDEEQKKKFLEQCKAWPDDVKNCLGDASDEAAIGACMQKVMQLEMEKAMKEAEKAGDAAKKAAEEATPPAPPAEEKAPE